MRDACGSSDVPFLVDLEVDAAGWEEREVIGVEACPGATLMYAGFDSQAKVA